MVAGGLALLLIGGEVLVRGAVTLAQRLSVPPLVIGLTVVAFGTSSPELVVSLDAVLSGAPQIAIGNVIGSNIANILLVLGLPAIIFPIVCDVEAIRRDGAIMFAISVAFVALCWSGQILNWQGAIMTSMLCGYLTWSYFSGREENDATAEAIVDEIEGIATRPHSIWLSLAFIGAGIAGLIFGADMLIGGAMELAIAAGVSEATIGLSLIGGPSVASHGGNDERLNPAGLEFSDRGPDDAREIGDPTAAHRHGHLRAGWKGHRRGGELLGNRLRNIGEHGPRTLVGDPGKLRLRAHRSGPPRLGSSQGVFP